jgi:hypothetical protein
MKITTLEEIVVESQSPKYSMDHKEVLTLGSAKNDYSENTNIVADPLTDSLSVQVITAIISAIMIGNIDQSILVIACLVIK